MTRSQFDSLLVRRGEFPIFSPVYLNRRRGTFSSSSIELALRQLRCLCTLLTFRYDLNFRRSQKGYRFL
ncbi:unnamed protein product [Acanthoscelides obtectus]|uniref:Uncharacterized protein n=1 Tax=Acanthoscelides obtectus TaxID=200917 RepID=A0A9P0KC48_ACAOB|nr:unnamed protein product [Acanthoscelides obtectus]CAK1660854.1 hypothetical protein AOBTE_LOCUS22297 [Acanthoscelides obtectus]